MAAREARIVDAHGRGGATAKNDRRVISNREVKASNTRRGDLKYGLHVCVFLLLRQILNTILCHELYLYALLGERENDAKSRYSCFFSPPS